MSPLKPLPANELLAIIANLSLSEQTAPVPAYVEAYEALAKKATLTSEEDKALFELALIIQAHNFFGKGTEAAVVFGGLVAVNGLEYYRPTPPSPDADEGAGGE